MNRAVAPEAAGGRYMKRAAAQAAGGRTVHEKRSSTTSTRSSRGTLHEKSNRTTSLKREAGAFPGALRFPPTNKLNLKDDS